jgi:hypothetical protein
MGWVGLCRLCGDVGIYGQGAWVDANANSSNASLTPVRLNDVALCSLSFVSKRISEEGKAFPAPWLLNWYHAVRGLGCSEQNMVEQGAGSAPVPPPLMPTSTHPACLPAPLSLYP